MIKKYGFIGYVNDAQFKAVSLDKYIKTKDLSDPNSRLSLYFNSELVSIKDKGEFYDSN